MEIKSNLYYDDLVARCKQGDMQSFRALYQRYAKAMYNTSLRIVNNSSDAEDVLQESFISAFSHLDDFDYSSAFGAWLKRIVINKSISLLRKRKLMTVDIETTAAAETADGPAYSEEETGLQVEKIKKAMIQLPNGYRAVLSLVLFEDCSYEEVGSLLNITATTARTQYHRARQKLWQILKTEGCDERQTETIYR